MASLSIRPPLLPLLAILFVRALAFDASIDAANFMFPFNCSAQISACSASLYHINHNLALEEIASFYSVNATQIKPIITRGSNQDFLITVPCSCKNTSDLGGYFYDTLYIVKPNDTFVNISEQIYSRQAWPVEGLIIPDQRLPIHLVCGCVESDSQIVETYTVQQNDSLSGIAALLSAELSGILSMNKALLQSSAVLQVGWVPFVPMEKNGIPFS